MTLAAESPQISEPEQARDDRFAVIERVRAAFADVSDEEIEAETDRILARLRAEARSARSDE